MSFSPPEVKDPPPAPTRDTASVIDAENAERRKRVAMRGRAATILTGPTKETPTTSAARLLGGS